MYDSIRLGVCVNAFQGLQPNSVAATLTVTKWNRRGSEGLFTPVFLLAPRGLLAPLCCWHREVALAAPLCPTAAAGHHASLAVPCPVRHWSAVRQAPMPQPLSLCLSIYLPLCCSALFLSLLQFLSPQSWTCHTATCVRVILKWLQVWGVTWEASMTGGGDKPQCHNHSAVSLSLRTLCPPCPLVLSKSHLARGPDDQICGEGAAPTSSETHPSPNKAAPPCVENSLYFLANIHYMIYAVALYQYCSSQLQDVQWPVDLTA